MIIESLIQDESKVTLDCAKATLHRGSKITIDDQFWTHPEIQGAIKCGFARLVGAEPTSRAHPGMPVIEPEVRFKNVYEYKLTFDCIKKYAAPGDVVSIPVSKIDSLEVRECIGRGWLVNLDNPEATPAPYRGAPLRVEELSMNDLVEPSAGVPRVVSEEEYYPDAFPEERQTRRASRPVVESDEPIKAKPISRKDEGSDDGDSYGGDSLYSESKVIDPMAPPARYNSRAAARRQMAEAMDAETVRGAAMSNPLAELTETPAADDGIEMGNAKPPRGDEPEDDSFGFIDVFQNAQPKKKG